MLWLLYLLLSSVHGQSHPPCPVCGDGQCVYAHDAIFEFPGQAPAPCPALQQAGINGEIGPEECGFLPYVIGDICECGPCGMNEFNSIMVGTYEFEIMNRPHKLYICTNDKDSSQQNDLYWSVTDVTTNEYVIAVGRGIGGLEVDYATEGLSAQSEMFRLYGDKIVKGEYALSLHDKYVLRERFPELIELNESDNYDISISDGWTTFELRKISPFIVGNTNLHGYQCFHPRGNNILSTFPMPAHIQSEYVDLDHGVYTEIIYPHNEIEVFGNLADCWKLVDEYGSIKQVGYNYGIQLEWNASLIISRFDNYNNRHDVNGCDKGSQFMIMVEEDLAIVSRQCDDIHSGRTYLAYINEYTDSTQLCPFELTPVANKPHVGPCNSHDDCIDGEFCPHQYFLNGGECSPCDECNECDKGVDNTCGYCGQPTVSDEYCIPYSTCNSQNDCSRNQLCISGYCSESGCFIAGTNITMCDKTIKLIEQIVVGDMVKGKDGCVEVINLDPTFLGNRDLYSFNNNNYYFFTQEHPFWTKQGWKSLNPTKTKQQDGDYVYKQLTGKLQIGDQILMENGQFFKVNHIKNKTMNNHTLPLYNFEVSTGSSYFADGYCVHNKR
eukprot:64142_1